MTINSRIRFLDPVDPREVFDFAAALVNMPASSFVHQAPGSEPLYLNDFWPLNPRICTAGGSDASVTVEYGAEGSRLIEEWEVYPEDIPSEQRGPQAYVLLDFESSGGFRYEDHPAWVQAVAYKFLRIPMAEQNYATGLWRPLLVGRPPLPRELIIELTERAS